MRGYIEINMRCYIESRSVATFTVDGRDARRYIEIKCAATSKSMPVATSF